MALRRICASIALFALLLSSCGCCCWRHCRRADACHPCCRPACCDATCNYTPPPPMAPIVVPH